MLLLYLTALVLPAQIADLGSARSAASEGYHWAEQPEPGGGGHGRGSVRFRIFQGLRGPRVYPKEVYPKERCALSPDHRCARCRRQRTTARGVARCR